jgi:hypothetical protein
VTSAALYELLAAGRVERINTSRILMTYKWRVAE